MMIRQTLFPHFAGGEAGLEGDLQTTEEKGAQGLGPGRLLTEPVCSSASPVGVVVPAPLPAACVITQNLCCMVWWHVGLPCSLYSGFLCAVYVLEEEEVGGMGLPWGTQSVCMVPQLDRPALPLSFTPWLPPSLLQASDPQAAFGSRTPLAGHWSCAGHR